MSQGMPYSLYTHRSLDLIFTIVMSYMINQKKKISKLEKVQYRACLAITSAIQGNQGKNVTTN